HRLLPGKLAVSIVDGGAGTMRSLAELEHRIAHSAPLGRAMPMIAPRGALPLDRMSWTPLLPEFARDDLPAIVWIEDLGGGLVEYPMGRGAPSAALIAQGLANLAAVPVELHDEQLGGTHVVVVADHPFAAEKLLDPATMRDVAARLGATGAQLLVAIPVRGMLLAIDALPALIDDARMTGFVRGAERMYQQASERDRISPEVFVYAYDRPLGLVGS
ncbi:MAG TPA: hypothetical protein VLX92_12845, partial [Kofleriaceae bacterium]|nr:hypothetical protein [Kofleriaceae bacterium]